MKKITACVALVDFILENKCCSNWLIDWLNTSIQTQECKPRVFSFNFPIFPGFRRHNVDSYYIVKHLVLTFTLTENGGKMNEIFPGSE